ncbi:MAG: hypothetical protein Q9195_003709 [Heterodermia aff. obscurata]
MNVTVNPKTGTAPPQLSQGTLFQGSPSDPSFYFYGGTTTWANASFPGFREPDSPTYSLWEYDVSTQAWSQYDISMRVPYRPSSGAHAEAPDQSLAFYLNGEINNGSSAEIGLPAGVSTFLTGMVVINTTDHTAKNISTAGVTGRSPRARAQMQYMSGIGEKGILVLLGGSSKTVGDYDTTDLLDDFSYMYGGRDAGSRYFDEIWVLSLPSFTWTQVFSGTSPRFGHTCHLVGNRTLLTVGGVVSIKQKSGQPDTDVGPCDWETKGLGVMDLTDIIWGSLYDAHAPAYGVPGQVIATIGGSPEGHANLTTPVSGFADDGLASLFGVKTLQKAHNPDKGHPLKAAVIAAPICVVVALLAFGGLIWWWWTKHRAGRDRTAEERPYYEKSEEPDVPREQVLSK